LTLRLFILSQRHCLVATVRKQHACVGVSCSISAFSDSSSGTGVLGPEGVPWEILRDEMNVQDPLGAENSRTLLAGMTSAAEL
jgi:hypothetical protein